MSRRFIRFSLQICVKSDQVKIKIATACCDCHFVCLTNLYPLISTADDDHFNQHARYMCTLASISAMCSVHPHYATFCSAAITYCSRCRHVCSNLRGYLQNANQCQLPRRCAHLYLRMSALNQSYVYERHASALPSTQSSPNKRKYLDGLTT